MVFYYAIPETLINLNHNSSCNHNMNDAQLISPMDPLLELDCIPSNFCKINYCQSCKQYYFYNDIENSTDSYAESKKEIDKLSINISKTKVCDESDVCMKKVSEKNRDFGFKNSNNQEILAPKIIKRANKDIPDTKMNEIKQKDTSLPSLLLSYDQVLKLSTASNSSFNSNSRNSTIFQGKNSKKITGNENFANKDINTSNKITSSDRNTKEKNEVVKSRKQETVDMNNNCPNKNISDIGKLNNKKKKTKDFAPSVLNLKGGNNPPFLTNKFKILDENIKEEFGENENSNTEEETKYFLAEDSSLIVQEIETERKIKGKQKKSMGKKERRKKNTSKLYEDEFLLDEIEKMNRVPQVSQNPLLEKNIGNFYADQREFITYKIKSSQTNYYDSDLQYIKAIIFTKFVELFSDYEENFYIFSKKDRKKIGEEDLDALNKHKKEISYKYEDLLKNDCGSYIFFYESDGIFLNCDFMLLNDFLEEYKSQNDLLNTSNDSKNKFIRRYELTKDRFIVFFFYFFHKLQFRNLNKVFLEEFIFFFFKFKNNKKILNSSKKFIYLLFCKTVNYVVLDVFEKSDSVKKLGGGSPDSFKIFKILMEMLTAYIENQNLTDLNSLNFLNFFKMLIHTNGVDINILRHFLKNEDKIDEVLTLEKRNKLEYFN
ncbi:hypothetical protein H312_03366 [Anncaliia algerae PRA339]|uniref:Uncharacterized protein n=1 Tax=Anncaliia algerae PRA339 TaxID=1288291 RepID=A0A059EWJ1_9MICR|nr:hypothetical protein H312_03366 [Anncaliia algerae PRA339]